MTEPLTAITPGHSTGSKPHAGLRTDPAADFDTGLSDPHSITGRLLLNRYQVREKIGSGGMGVVYIAHDLVTGKKVAVKQILMDKAQPTSLKRFAREISILKNLGDGHPNIVKIYASDVNDLAPFIVMEYLSGGSFKEVIDSIHEPSMLHPINLKPVEVLTMFAELSNALGYIYKEHGIVHRDIKPSNLLLSVDDKGIYTVKITDFGLAKPTEISDVSFRETCTDSGKPIGTAYYMSPEQVDGRTVLDDRSDIYSLGASLYELLTGKVPFKPSNTLEIFKIGEKKIKPPKELNPTIPDVLDRLINDSLSVHQLNRPKAIHFETRLRQILSSPEINNLDFNSPRRQAA